MTTMNKEIYTAFKLANVPDEAATAAGMAVSAESEVATKEDLKDLEIRLTWRMIALLGLTIAILKLIL